jgi:2-iminobutanoate/2-iminopropanoate deaminase
MIKKTIDTNHAPKAIGPYSQAIGIDQMIFTSGQLPLDPGTGKFAEGGIKEQTRQSLLNLQAVLAAGESDFSHVLKTNVFLNDMNDFTEMNQVYAEFFKGDFPARSAVQVAKLPMGALVEVEAVAVRADSE